MATEPINFSTRSISRNTSMSTGSPEHVVQFYGKDPSFFINDLASYLESALGAGGSVLVVANPSHREKISEQLRKQGLLLDQAAGQGRYIEADAAEMLSRFMAEGKPEEVRFFQVIGGLMERATSSVTSKTAPVAVFGEMVALLWDQGNLEGAIALEHLWNQLAKTYHFSLRCAYPLESFDKEEHAASVRHICSLHSQVIPGEEYSSSESEEERQRTIVLLQQKAEALKNEVFERRRIEETLALREEELADLLENAPQAVQQVGPDQQILWANPALLEMLGYSYSEYIGHPLSEFHVDQKRLNQFWAKLKSGERVMDFPVQLRCKTGKIRQVLLRSNAVRVNGEFVRSRCFVQDITDRNEAEDTRRWLAAIVESSDDAIVSKNLQSIIASWNPGAERLFGYSAEEMIGQSIRKIIPPELVDEEDRILEKIARGERIEHFETVRMTKYGKRVHVSLTVSPVRNQNGEIVGAAKIARDITKQKRIEEGLRLAEKLASVGRLAATVAHEVNNPLEAVTNLVYLAKLQAKEPDQVETFLGMAQEELRRVSLITQQTLGFYREHHGARNVTLREPLQQLISILSPKAESRGIDIRLEVRSDPHVWAVSGEIRQLLGNLLNNSIDAIKTNGRIRIRVSPAHTWTKDRKQGVRITIADSGPGIPEEHREKIFEPFFTTKEDVGTGLGLWICDSIVSKLSGRIQLKSRTAPGNSGTVFSIFLPQVTTQLGPKSRLEDLKLAS